MYRCEICNHVSQPHEPRKVHVVHREVPDAYGGTREEIAREIPVCGKCQALLNNGEKSLEQLTREHTYGKSPLQEALPIIQRAERIKSGVSVMFS